MGSLKDDRGYNQGFKPTEALKVRTQRRCDYIANQMNDSLEGEVLEIGCGTGEISYLLSKRMSRKVYGTDICEPFLKGAREKYKNKNLSYDYLDFNDVSGNKKFKNKEFAYIIGNGILHHLYYNLDKDLLSLWKLLADGGKMVFLEPNILNPYCQLIFKNGYFRKRANLEPDEMAFTKKFIERKLRNNNFKNICVEYKDFLLPVTPESLIIPNVKLGNLLESTPLLRKVSQSIYVTAEKHL